MLNLQPLRDEGANKISTTIYHFSRKLGRQVWCESNLEWIVAILLEHDPTVVDYCEQGLEIPYKEGKWTVDFVVLFKNGKRMAIEVKYLIDLLDEENKKDYIKKYDTSEKWCLNNGYEFVVVTDQIVGQNDRVDNCRKFMESVPNKDDISKIQPAIQKIVAKRPFITVSELVEQTTNYLINTESYTETSRVLDVLYFMIYNDKFDLSFGTRITNQTQLTLRQKFSKPIISLETYFQAYHWKDQVLEKPDKTQTLDLHSIPPEHLEIAKEKFETIEPLIFRSSRAEVDKIARENNVSSATIWSWLSKYRENSSIRDLLPKYSLKGVKKKYKDDNPLLKYGIEEYLQLERPKISIVYEKIEAKAEELKIPVFSYDTFRRRILEIKKKDRIRKRYGWSKSRKEFSISEGHFPHADWALQTVQIDHTPIDVKVVDDEDRVAIGRPYLTVAIDIHSRVVLGYCLTFEKPSRLSVATTLLNCVESKEHAISKVETYYPELSTERLKTIENSDWRNIQGLPKTLHMDNASEFRSKDLKLFCNMYGIHMQFRPVNESQYGAHVERYLGTLNGRLQSLSGTTFSNRIEAEDYKSDKKAVYTLNELEARIVTEFIIYHDKYHEGIKTTPIDKWSSSFKNTHPYQTSSMNLPENFDQFKLDVLPSDERTVQKSGISIFNLKYQTSELSKWINTKDPKTNKSKKFRIRYDPRDIRQIYFYDPDEQAYITVGCNELLFNRLFRDTPISKWEWEATYSDVVQTGRSKEDKDKRLKVIATQIEMDEISKRRTNAARKRRSRRKRRSQEKAEHIPLADEIDGIEVISGDENEEFEDFEEEYEMEEGDWIVENIEIEEEELHDDKGINYELLDEIKEDVN